MMIFIWDMNLSIERKANPYWLLNLSDLFCSHNDIGNYNFCLKAQLLKYSEMM